MQPRQLGVNTKSRRELGSRADRCKMAGAEPHRSRAASQQVCSEAAPPLRAPSMTPLDLRCALRRLRRHLPGLPRRALTLALGIAAVTAPFRVVRAVLLRPPPFRDPATLAGVRLHPLSRPDGRLEVSYPDYRPAAPRSWSREASHSTAHWVRGPGERGTNRQVDEWAAPRVRKGPATWAGPRWGSVASCEMWSRALGAAPHHSRRGRDLLTSEFDSNS
jgi:hypothetical protein